MAKTFFVLFSARINYVLEHYSTTESMSLVNFICDDDSIPKYIKTKNESYSIRSLYISH